MPSGLSESLQKERPSPEEMEDDDVVVIRTTEKQLKEAEKKLVRDIQNLNKVPKSLGRFSMMAGIFQFLQSIPLFIIASNTRQRWYVFTDYPVVSQDIENPGVIPALNQIYAVNVLWYSPIFILLSGMEHFCCLFFHDTYTWYVARNQNPFRWTEYTFSASLIRVMIAQLVGVTNIYMLFTIYMLTAITLQWGYTMEAVNAKAHADGIQRMFWRPFIMALVTHVSCYFIIFAYFTTFVQTQSNRSLLYAIIILLFLSESCFGVVLYMQWTKTGPMKDFVASEKAHIVLSFTAKTLMAWLAVGLAS